MPRRVSPWAGRLRTRTFRKCASDMLYTVVHGLTTPPRDADGADGEFAPEVDWAECIFCGAPRGCVDHLHPVRRRGRLTGFCNERWNTVPACVTCNSSKCGRDWREWMQDPRTRGSPAARGVPDLEARVRAVEAFDRAAERHRTMLRASARAQRLLARVSRKVDRFCEEVSADVRRLRGVLWADV